MKKLKTQNPEESTFESRIIEFLKEKKKEEAPIYVLMATLIVKRYIVVLNLPTKINDRIQACYDIQDGCLNHTGLPASTWTIPLATVLLHINAARDAATASIRRDAMLVMNNDMTQIKMDMQTVITAMTIGQETMLTNARLHWRVVEVTVKDPLSITDNDEAGKLDFALYEKSLLEEGQNATMIKAVRWEQSQNNVNWMEVPDSYYEGAKMTKGNYMSGSTWFFRVRLVLTKKRLSPWALSGAIKVK